MRGILARLEAGETLLADGALGTMLFARGLSPGVCPESVNLEHPDWLEEIARAYVEAGAEFITTNTFGATPIKLAMSGLAERMEEINRIGVGAVRRVVGSKAYVAGSCGPCGGLLKPYGTLEPEMVQEGYRRQLRVLIDEGVDAIFIETMTDLSEATLAVRAAREISTTLPVMATMTFDPTPRGFYTIMGVSIGAAARGLAEAGADVVGSNCGNGIERMVEVARAFRECASRPVLIQSNAGLPRREGGGIVYPETPEFMAGAVSRLVDLGISIIGGCCGTTPEHIRAMREVLDAS